MLLTTTNSSLLSLHDLDIINPTIEFHYSIFSKTKDLFYHVESTLYNEKKHRETLISLAYTIFMKIFYYDYFHEKDSSQTEFYTYITNEFNSKNLNDFYYQMLEKKKISYTETNYNIKISHTMFQNNKKNKKENEEYIFVEALISSAIGFEDTLNKASNLINKKNNIFHHSKIENTYNQYMVILSLINKINMEDSLTNHEITEMIHRI